MSAASIRKLEWDSAFFGRTIGVLQMDGAGPSAVDRLVDDARASGYDYIICRPAIEDAPLIRALGRARFYLSDQGVTWAMATSAWAGASPTAATDVVDATERDIDDLQRLVRFMFADSRFYHDPFYSTDDAERLHAEWIRNSVLKRAASRVLWIPGAGFVTLKQQRDVGEIVLIGVEPSHRSRGLGRTLLTAAMDTFAADGTPRVTVRTQLRNLRASNFYRAHGFTLDGADVTFSLMLSESR